MSKEIIKAGAASEEITPKDSQFLYGYPYVERMSQGAHDPLTCTALYIDNGSRQVMFISHDILYLNKEQVAAIRAGISAKTGVPAGNILVSVTHTHSAPTPFDVVISRNDSVVPPADKNYMAFVVEQSVSA
ncbi:MAG: hypothetical protein II143_04920, partial [Bacteroidales bacterium]|nr:hypothetical protein [Bacteroidales bacterium]